VICPFCGASEDRVVDSRTSEGGRTIRRRRFCNVCERRFTTYERAETTTRLMVVKRDGTRQAFDPQRMLHGIEAACAKRPIPAEKKQQIIDEIEEELFREFDREVPSERIGQAIMNRLQRIDQVAYVRFASVYKEFKDLDELLDEVREAKERASSLVPGQGELFADEETPKR